LGRVLSRGLRRSNLTIESKLCYPASGYLNKRDNNALVLPAIVIRNNPDEIPASIGASCLTLDRLALFEHLLHLREQGFILERV